MKRRKNKQRRNANKFGSLIDSLVTAISPQAGLKRKAWREYSKLTEDNIRAARKQIGDIHQKPASLRQRSWKQVDGDDSNRSHRKTTDNYEINSLLEQDLAKAQTEGIALYGENSIAHAAVEARVTYEVGDGLTAQPTVRQRDGIDREKAREINSVLKETMIEWSDHGVDITRTMPFSQYQRLLCRNFANYGEEFVLIGESSHEGSLALALTSITPERVETPPDRLADPLVRCGVQYYPNGQVHGYWVRKSTPNDDKDFEYGHDFYPRRDPRTGDFRMLHIFEPMFTGQSRGIPWLLSSFNKILDIDDYLESEIIAKQVEACFGIIFKVDTKDGPNALDLVEAVSERTDEGLMEDINPGFIQRIGVDDDVKVVDPARPGANFQPFVERSLRFISASANIPYEVVAKDFFRTTFASGRLAMLDGQMGFRMRRSILVNRGLRPIYHAAVKERILRDELDGLVDIRDFNSNPSIYLSHKWLGSTMGLIDPEKEVKAAVLAIDNELTTKADFYGGLGSDWESAEAQTFEERKAKIDRSLELEKYEMDERSRLGLPEMNPDPEEGEEEEPNKNEESNADKATSP